MTKSIFDSEGSKMLKSLLREAEKEGIEVVYLPFNGKLKGLYYDNVIAINKKISTTAEKTCILAEELVHYYTTVGNILDQKQLTNRKLERRAMAWGYQRLVPLDKLILAYKQGVRSRYELAEFLEVTEQFLVDALKYYKEKYGPYRQVGDYYICFEPLAILQDFQEG